MLNPILNQVNSKQNFRPTYGQLFAIYEYIITNVKDDYLAIVSHIVGILNNHPQCYISQTALAERHGYCRKSITRIIKKLCDMGLLSKVFRPNKTCLYSLNPIFEHKSMRYLLERVIKSFYFINISMLLVWGCTNSPLVKNPYVYHKSHYQGEMSHEENNRIFSIRYDTTQKSRVSRSGHSPGSSLTHRSGIKTEDPRRGIPMNKNKRIKTLKLNRVGEIKIAAFPQEARDYADKMLREYKKPIKDHFRFYSMACREYCNQHKITPEWRITFSLLAKEGYDNDAMSVDPKDPYIYEELIAKELDPTIPKKSRTSDSDNTPKESIYHTAEPPTLIRETPEQQEAGKEKLRAASEGSKGGFSASDFAAILLGK